MPTEQFGNDTRIGFENRDSDVEASYVFVVSGITDDRLPLSVQRANSVVGWLRERPDGESAARVLSEAAAESRDAVFSLEQRAVVFDELQRRRQRPPSSIDFDRALTEFYFELLLEFGQFRHSKCERF